MAKDKLRYRVVAIGGSAGSLEAILQIVPKLPVNSGACFVIVIHRKYDPDSPLTDILSKYTTLAVKEVEDKEALLPDTIYIAPADYHLLIEDENMFSLDSSEKVQYSRPSIDVTFESVADVFGISVVGVLLSGANADGAEGLKHIRERGGYAIVQSPQSAEIGFMPQQAIDLNAVDKIVDVGAIGSVISGLLSLPS
jgi:two-component system chemotaxis response regulator CheB